MISSNITLSQGISSFAASIKTTGSVTKRQGPEEKISLPENGKAEAGRPAFNTIQTVNSSSNAVSLSVRVADNAMKEIGKHVEQMKTDLENIAQKTYPPYPSGSEERTKILKSYSAFRRLINQLTIPPDNQGAMKIMADPAVTKEYENGDFAEGNDLYAKLIQSRQVHAGPNGLDIPELSEDATAGEINDAINHIDNAREKLSQRQSGLAQDVQDVAHIKENNPSKGYTKGLNLDYEVGFGLANGSEYMAGKSMEVKNTLTVEPVKSLTGSQSKLAILLE